MFIFVEREKIVFSGCRRSAGSAGSTGPAVRSMGRLRFGKDSCQRSDQVPRPDNGRRLANFLRDYGHTGAQPSCPGWRLSRNQDCCSMLQTKHPIESRDDPTSKSASTSSRFLRVTGRLPVEQLAAHAAAAASGATASGAISTVAFRLLMFASFLRNPFRFSCFSCAPSAKFKALLMSCPSFHHTCLHFYSCHHFLPLGLFLFPFHVHTVRN